MNVFITGPARGIGEAVARMMAARGHRIALVGLEPERLATLAAELGPQHLWVECDVTDSAALTRATEETMRAFGGIDVVVANAGIATNGPVVSSNIDALARLVDVNLTGVIRTVHATLPHVIASNGYMLIISSAAAFAPAVGLATYAATKAGVEQFGNGLRVEVMRKGVGVGVAHPCWIDTDLVRDARNDLDSFNKTIKRLPGPFGVITPLEDCAKALVEGIEQRSRRIFIPKSLRWFAALRQLLMSKWVDDTTARQMKKALPAMEEEAKKLGRPFGKNSVESKRFS